MNNTFLEKVKKMIERYVEEPLDKIQQRILEYLSKHADIFIASALIKLLVKQQKRSYHKKELRKKLEKHKSKSASGPESEQEEQLLQEIEVETNKLTSKQYTKIKEDIKQCIKRNDTGKLELYIKKLGIKFVQDTGALHFAAKHGKVPALKLMLEHGADVNARDSNRETPLHHAAKHGNLKAVDFLVTKGKAKVNLRDVQGRTPLDALELSPHANSGMADRMRTLMERWGAKRNVTHSNFLEKQALKAQEKEQALSGRQNTLKEEYSALQGANKGIIAFGAGTTASDRPGGSLDVRSVNYDTKISQTVTKTQASSVNNNNNPAKTANADKKTEPAKDIKQVSKNEKASKQSTQSFWNKLGQKQNASPSQPANEQGQPRNRVSFGLGGALGRGFGPDTKKQLQKLDTDEITIQTNQLPKPAKLFEQQLQR
ncbi:MAG: ankyrin repeat domain-containing protein [Rickettsiales bacterium]|nr:ankyrin repeat domain-containing protein [Rickettsiales bacterium]